MMLNLAQSRPQINGRIAVALMWFALAYGVLALVLPFILAAVTGVSLLDRQNLVFDALGVAALVAAGLAWSGRRAAFWMLFVVFLLQTIEFYSPSGWYSLSGPLGIHVNVMLHTVPGRLDINVMAIVMCVASLAALLESSSRFAAHMQESFGKIRGASHEMPAPLMQHLSPLPKTTP